MLDCDGVIRRLWDYLEGDLSRERTIELAAHLAVCQRCHPQIAFEQVFLTVLASARSPGRPAGALRRRVMAMLEAEGLRPPSRAGAGETRRHQLPGEER